MPLEDGDQERAFCMDYQHEATSVDPLDEQKATSGD